MQRFKNLLLVLNEDSIGQEVALKRAVGLALVNQASLTIIDILPDVPHDMTRLMGRSWSLEVNQLVVKQRRSELEELAERFAKEVPVTIDVLQGTPFLEIVRKVLKGGYDLVLKTVQRKNVMQRMLFGSADMSLLRKCPCPVWLLKPGEPENCQCVLAAVDIEPSADDERMEALNRKIVKMASSVAFGQFSELHIVHAWHVVGQSMLNSYRFKSQKEEVERWIEAQSQEIKSRHKAFKKQLQTMLSDKEQDHLHLKIHMIKGHAELVIPRLAEEIKADLVVMGTVARTGLPGFLMGNTAEGILNQLNCSVLAIKPEGFVTSVTLDK